MSAFLIYTDWRITPNELQVDANSAGARGHQDSLASVCQAATFGRDRNLYRVPAAVATHQGGTLQLID